MKKSFKNNLGGNSRKPMETFGTHEKVAMRFHCEFCDYFTSRKSNFDKHCLTGKHLSCYNGNPKVAKVAKVAKFTCQGCGQHYKSKGGLWKHLKKCGHQETKTQMIIDIIKDDKQIHNYLIEQNKLLIEQLSQQNKHLIEQNTRLFEIAQQPSQQIVGTMNNLNCTNKFNINVFLNETCKNAINLTDFVNQISLSIEDLEETGKNGYVEGISNVFIKNLNDIDYSERPIHCSDSKRDTLYIKDDNQWVKDDKEKLTNAIKTVANKNIKQIPDWQKAHPDYNDPNSKQNDQYMKMVYEVMSGSTVEEQQKNYNKIIKNISKNVVINKDMYK